MVDRYMKMSRCQIKRVFYIAFGDVINSDMVTWVVSPFPVDTISRKEDS